MSHLRFRSGRLWTLGCGAALLTAAIWASVGPSAHADTPPAAAPQVTAGSAAPTATASASVGSSATTVPSTPAAPQIDEKTAAAGKKAFAQVASVLQSPRCMNCHPTGEVPLQGDNSRPHAMNVSRVSTESGLECTTCHQDKNAEAVGVKGGPPGAPHWSLPPKKTPMVFQGKTQAALCEQLKDPGRNGQRTLAALLEHVSHDALVLWAWKPGGKRTVPPLSHETFVTAFSTWVASEGACPQ